MTSIGDSMAQPIGELLADAQAKGQPYSVNYEFKSVQGLRVRTSTTGRPASSS